jgi:hypothetical protein
VRLGWAKSQHYSDAATGGSQGRAISGR